MFKGTTAWQLLSLHVEEQSPIITFKNVQWRKTICQSVRLHSLFFLFLSWLELLTHLPLTLLTLKSRSYTTTVPPQPESQLVFILCSELLISLAMSADSIICSQSDICSCFPGLQAQSTSREKEHTCSSDRGKAQSGRDSWEWTRVIVDSEKTQSKEESPARILPVCTSHPHTQTCRYPPFNCTHEKYWCYFLLAPLHRDLSVPLNLVDSVGCSRMQGKCLSTQWNHCLFVLF